MPIGIHSECVVRVTVPCMKKSSTILRGHIWDNAPSFADHLQLLIRNLVEKEVWFGSADVFMSAYLPPQGSHEAGRQDGQLANVHLVGPNFAVVIRCCVVVNRVSSPTQKKKTLLFTLG